MKSGKFTAKRRKVGNPHPTPRARRKGRTANADAFYFEAGHSLDPVVGPFDSFSRAIIKLLQEDGRLPFARIAEALDVSEGSVRNRVNRMIEAKVLRIMGIANPLALGYTGYAMVGMQISP